ncbi:DUF1553 domain-containing protein [Planctomycetaceae bacterium SH139]
MIANLTCRLKAPACLLLVSLLVGLPVSSRGQAPEAAETETLSPSELQFFETKIRPVLVEHCYSCHSSEGNSIRGGLTVDSRQGLLGGGQSGPAVVPHDPEESLLWTAMNHLDFEMPPNRKLSAETIADFRQWIEMGAPDPRRVDLSEIRSTVSAEDIVAGRSYWAFQPPQSHPLPPVAQGAWRWNDVDTFLLAGIERAELELAADAAASTILRRLHFDLVGLPPTPQRQTAFSRAHRVDAAAAIAAEVDHLLSLPQFGERWGRHWLDVARYAESSGKEVELTFPHAWRYRDWVIDAWNADMPYDQFIRAQVAGDLLPVDNDRDWANNLIATGFLALGPKTLTERNPRQFIADQVDEQIDVTTRAILGISVACARCHDHKFDPIPQTDYYALAGIFESSETYFGGLVSRQLRQSSNLLVLPLENLDQPAIEPAELAELKSRLAEKQAEVTSLQRDFLRLNRPASGNTKQTGNNLQQAQAKVRAAEREVTLLKNRLNQYDESGQPQAFCLGVQDAEQPTSASLLVRGEINQPAGKVERGFVQVIGPGPAIPADSSGRLELAQWLTDRQNPLTARVMVNRIWLHLMGKPLVAETENFGFSGQPPTHPELLDHLAVQFMDSGWSLKTMIREIATSRAYQLSSQVAPASRQKDLENEWYARGNRRRLEAEAIRDAMLVASEMIDWARPRGSAIAAVGTTVLGPGGLALPVNGLRSRPQPLSEFTANYRSVYLPIARNAVPRSLEVFDFAEPNMIVGQRETSNTAIQSLYLLNNPFVIDQSIAFARRLQSESSSPAEAVELAFQTAFGRAPTSAERTRSLRFLQQTARDQTREPLAVATLTERRRMSRREMLRARLAQGMPGLAELPDGREQARNFIARNFPNAGGSDTTELEPLTQFCQALLAAAEFRYVP